jgi:hypothetical protein
MFQQSIKVSLIAVSVEQLIYLFSPGVVSCHFCRQTFRDTPVNLKGRSILTNKDTVEGLGTRDWDLNKKKGFSIFVQFFQFVFFFFNSCFEVVFGRMVEQTNTVINTG